MIVSEAVSSRRSIRAFLETPVSLATIRRVLERASMTPSGCNFQPWEATVLTGEALRRLQAKLADAQPDDPQEYDYSAPSQHTKYRERMQQVGASMYGALQISRSDEERRAAFAQDIVAAAVQPMGSLRAAGQIA